MMASASPTSGVGSMEYTVKLEPRNDGVGVTDLGRRIDGVHRKAGAP